MAKHKRSGAEIEIDDEAGCLFFSRADANTLPENGGPGALILELQLNGDGKRRTRKVIKAADINKTIKLGEFLATFAIEALAP